MKSSKDRVNSSSSSDNSRPGSPDIVEFVHKKAQELGFKVPQNAMKSTRPKKKRICQNSDDESTFTLPSRAYINAQGSTPSKSKKKEMSTRTAPTKARSLISNCSKRQDMIIKNTSYSNNQVNSIYTNRKNNLEKSATSLSKNALSKDKKPGRSSKSDSSKLPPEKRPRRPRVSGIAYMEARPPPTLYMPDDDDETIIKEVMLSMDKLGNESKSYNYAGGAIHNGYCCDGCHMDPILGTRFLCMNCDESREVDLCEDCMIEGKFENEYHKKTHRFSAIVN
ncbi:hypothetical protein C2G38_956408 [Gigaspora rosea]|uniref:ZZ-type domain-containing protein n=1 Tax=Gigaspora rosea TaxID=44941 RepID=A0A397VRY1_9GLOM|nr:hypothetical protein C2G38_956408 [Gigaspora rosea]